MRSRRPTDWVSWRQYRAAWVPAMLALLVVAATGFRPEHAPPAQLPPTYTAEAASELVERADAFDRQFPDRQVGSPGALEAAQFVRDEFQALQVESTLVPGTTSIPGQDGAMGIVNVEATLPGRTPETVVVVARRDTTGPAAAGSDGASTIALLDIASELIATRDRRRTWMLVSTDGGAANGAGSRLLSRRLLKRQGRVVAVIALDRIGERGVLDVPPTASGEAASAVGLLTAARDAAEAEGGVLPLPALGTQALRLAAPLTLREHGQLVRAGLPAITITRGDERVDATRPARTDAPAVAQSVRTLQRVAIWLEGIDGVQSAGKTYVVSEDRVYRGWALKILAATLLLPVWVACVDIVVRHRRRWPLVAAAGSVARAALAGIWSIGVAWALSGVGLLPHSSDVPPRPDLPDAGGAFGVVVWLLLTCAGWMVARAPDWRRNEQGPGRDHATLAVGMLVLVLLSVFALAANPYAVLLVAPALHAWLWLCSRHVHAPARLLLLWSVGAASTAGLVLLALAPLGAGGGLPGYLLAAVSMRAVPATVGLLLGMGAAVAMLLAVAAAGRVARPALPGLVRVARGEVAPLELLPRRPYRRPLAASAGRGRARRRPQRRNPVGGARRPLELIEASRGPRAAGDDRRALARRERGGDPLATPRS